ncbi:MAG: UxaA family hydrolase [Syntrophobacteraceae bacterium]
MPIDALVIKPEDNVATALRDIRSREDVTVGYGAERKEIHVQEPIPYGHKFAVRDIPLGMDILKYGEVMGRATSDIPMGTHAHVHNIESLRGRGDLAASEGK